MLQYSFTRKHICLYCHFVAFIWMVYDFDFKLISLAALRIWCGYLFSIIKLWINQSTFHSFIHSFVRSFVHSFRSILWMWCSDAPNFVSNLQVVTGTLQGAQNAPRPLLISCESQLPKPLCSTLILRKVTVYVLLYINQYRCHESIILRKMSRTGSLAVGIYYRIVSYLTSSARFEQMTVSI